MRIERAAKFGLAATLGVGVISLATGWLVWTQYSTTISGTEPAWVLMLGIGVAGLAANLMLLFALIGEYVDREMEARGLAGPEK
jgi:Co/Zn/Cd efflux system component